MAIINFKTFFSPHTHSSSPLQISQPQANSNLLSISINLPILNISLCGLLDILLHDLLLLTSFT